MKIAVIGATGQLGMDVYQTFEANGDEVIRLGHSDIEIDRADSVNSVFDNMKADIVVNTAAYHQVDKCEAEPAEAFAVNGIGAWNLAKASLKNDFYLIHISTDYVFDGAKQQPYIESDCPSPVNAYGNTKVAGEFFISSTAKRYLIMRTSGLYGTNPCRAKGGMNFVQLMLKLAAERDEIRVVDHEVLTPTSTLEVARQILTLSRSNAYGICHATAEGVCSWYRFAQQVFKLKNTDINLQIAGPNEFPAKTPRPEYSVLENEFLKKRGLNVFKSWEEGLKEYLM